MLNGYEGKYQVSNLGNVKNIIKNRILRQTKNNIGYLSVTLNNGVTKKWVKVHRLVAETFIPNIENKPQVNHKDENKLNNCVNNLEWCTSVYNANYGDRNYKISINNGKMVKQYDLKGNFIKTYHSARFAGRSCNINPHCISACCRGEIKKSGGFIWEYVKY